MKTAKAIVLVAVVVCPDCGTSILPTRDGVDSYDWTPDTIDDSVKTIVCDDCGGRFKIPAIKFS